jgi:uncharacterized sulfatase
MDLKPSLLRLAGAEPSGTLDGEDFLDTILGRQDRQDRAAPIFWRRPPNRPGPANNPFPDFAVRHKNWKFMMQFDRSRLQLYDLDNDISETKNLAWDHPDLAAEFADMILQWNAGL